MRASISKVLNIDMV